MEQDKWNKVGPADERIIDICRSQWQSVTDRWRTEGQVRIMIRPAAAAPLSTGTKGRRVRADTNFATSSVNDASKYLFNQLYGHDHKTENWFKSFVCCLSNLT